jgi:hypothetical protein
VAINDVPRPGLSAFELDGSLSTWTPNGGTPPIDNRRLAIFEDRLYLGNFAYDLASRNRIEWPGTFNGDWFSLPNLGLASASAQFFPRLDDPPMVTGLSARADGHELNLAWSPAVGASSYVVEAGSSAGLTNLAAMSTTATQFSATAPSGIYFIRLRAQSLAGLGPPSNEVRVALGPDACSAPPATPSDVRASANGSIVTMQWDAPTNAAVTNYVVEVSASANAPPYFRVGAGRRTSVASSAPSGEYFLRVKAENGCGVSAPSGSLRVAVLP